MEQFDDIDNELFTPPADKNVPIWRYMDFTRFVSLLNSGSLYLTRCDQFDDHFEGSVVPASTLPRLENRPDELLDKAALTPNQLQGILAGLWRKYQRQYVFINCWHINSQESAAFWRLYGKKDQTIAIQTTYAKLREALPDRFYVGEVNYVDHQTYMNNEKEGFFSVMCKRKSFAYERELRVCYVDSYEFQQDSKDPKEFFLEANPRLFETVPVDLQTLIDSVRIAPDAPAWFVELTKDTLIRFGYDLPVCQSRFNEYPFY
ncbi:hypothetical protein [Spirosoma aerophilum]